MARPRIDPLALVPFGVALLIYAPILAHDFVDFDDPTYVFVNRMVTDPSAFSAWERLTTPHMGYAIPLPLLIYGWVWGLAGKSAFAFHALSLGVHLVNVALVRRFARGLGPGSSAGFWAALLFATHPLMVEPVAWVTGLKDLLMAAGLLWLLGSGGRVRGIWGMCMALASKPAGALVPAVLLLGRGTGDSASHSTRRYRVQGAVGLLAGLLLLLWTRAQEGNTATSLEGVSDPWMRAFGALGAQAAHLLWPMNLSVAYDWATMPQGMYALGGGVTALASTALAFTWWRTRDARLLGLAAAMLAWVPVSNLVPLLRFTSDSYVYLPWACLSVVLGVTLSRRRPGHMSHRVVILLAAFATLGSIRQVHTWRDTTTLWANAYRVDPDRGDLAYRYTEALRASGDDARAREVSTAAEPALRASGHVPPSLLRDLRERGQWDALDGWYDVVARAPFWLPREVYAEFMHYALAQPARVRLSEPHRRLLWRGLQVRREDQGQRRPPEAELQQLRAWSEATGQAGLWR